MTLPKRAALIAFCGAALGLGLAACGGATTNGVRTGMGRPMAMNLAMQRSSAEPPPATSGPGRMWWASATTIPKKTSNIKTEVVALTIENVKSPEGSEPAFVGPGRKPGAAVLFSVTAHAEVKVVVVNHDSGPHTFTAPGLGVNVTLAAGAKTTFQFAAPGAGTYVWYCEVPCGPWVMSHPGYMKGKVTVS